MDIFTHALSGIAVATCLAGQSQKLFSCKAKILISGAFGAIIPDLDAISHWSLFDFFFGRLFGLSLTGKEIYTAKLWYSHHAFFHSLLGSFVLGSLFVFTLFLFHRIASTKKSSLIDYCKNSLNYFIAFVLGFWMHLLGDIITPGASWGGIALFFPYDRYIGGLGKVWWWNNYDLFLIFAGCIIFNLIVLLLSTYLKKYTRKITSIILCCTFLLVIIQIYTRKYDYAYSGYTSKFTEMEQNSKKEQKRILSPSIYSWMERLDKRLPIFF